MNSSIKNHGRSCTLYEIEFIKDTSEGCLIKYNDREIWIDRIRKIAMGPDWIRIPTRLAKLIELL